MTNETYGKLSVGLIGAWSVASLTASALGVFQSDPARPPLAVGLAAATPVLAFLAWFAASDGFRRFLYSLDLKLLTLVQTWRINAVVFLILASYGILPSVFAGPAGWGDILIGVTAPLVALKLAAPGHRKGFLLWQALGMADLVMAVSLGTAARLLDPHGVPMDAMAVLPLSLVPTFLVPLFLIFHIICIAQARAWNAASGTTRQPARPIRSLATDALQSQQRAG